MRRRGFTLVELLTAIAVVVLLAGILIPVVGGAIESAHKSKCASNLRQLFNATVLYSQDHNGNVMPNLGEAKIQPTWPDALVPYLDLVRWSYAIPGERPTGVFADPASDNICSGGSKSDYGKNELVSKLQDSVRTLGSVANPSRTIFLADSGDGKGNCVRDLAGWKGGSFGMEARHGDQVNMVFFDGHVESKPLTEIIFNNKEAPWNPDK